MNNNHLYAIDGSLTNIKEILRQLPEAANYIVLNPTQNGILQIANYLHGFQQQSFSSLHIVSHGSDGQFVLGDGVINADTLSRYHSELAEIGKYLTDSGDVLLYGCDIAKTDGGKVFVQRFAAAIAADVAASDDITAAAPPAPPPTPTPPPPEPQESQEGDDELEYEVGEVEQAIHAPIVAATAPLQMPPSEPSPSHPFSMSGDRTNGVVTLGGKYSGRFDNYSEAHNYIITADFDGFAHIVGRYYDANAGGKIYFEKGVQIIGINEFASGSVNLAGGGVVVFAFADEWDFYVGNTAMSYGDLHTAVRAVTDGGGTYTIGSHIDTHAIEYKTSGTDGGGFVGGSEENSFTLGFSRPVEAGGGGGNDTYRLSRFQTENATITDSGNGDLVILEYGVQVTGVRNLGHYEITFIGGDETTPTEKTLTVTDGSSNFYQLGDNADLRFSGQVLTEQFANYGLPIDLGLDPALRRQWLDSEDLTAMPAGTGILANLSTAAITVGEVEVAAAAVQFYNPDGLLADGEGATYAITVGNGAFNGASYSHSIAGSEGDDIIVGSSGDNYLRGGGGKDQFVFSGIAGQDVIGDFKSGTDTIVLNNNANFVITTGLIIITDDQNQIQGYILADAVTESDVSATIEPAADTPASPFNAFVYDGEGDYTIRGNTIIHQGSRDRTFNDEAEMTFSGRNANSRIILEDISAKIKSIASTGDSEILDLSAIFSNMQFNPGAESVKVGDDYTLAIVGIYGFIGGGKDDIFTSDPGGLDNLFDGKGADTQDGDQIIYGAFTGTVAITADNEWLLSSASYGSDTIIDIENFAFTWTVDMTLTANDEGFSDTVAFNFSGQDDSITLQSPYDGLNINGGNGDDSIIFTFEDVITISADTITSGSHTLQYSGVETISVHEDSNILFDDLNVPTIANVTAIGIGDGLVSGTITLTERGMPDTITDGTHTIAFAEGISVAGRGGKNDDTFHVFRQGGVSGGEGKDTMISDKIHGSNHRGGGGAEDAITYTDLAATVNMSFAGGVSSYTGLPFPNGIDTGSGQDALSEIETVNINGHDGGSTLNFSSFIEDIPVDILHIAMVGGAGHGVDFSRVSVDLTIDVGGQQFSYGSNTVTIVGFSDFTGGGGETRFIDDGTAGGNSYAGEGDSDIVVYEGSDSLSGSIRVVNGDITFSGSNYGTDIFKNIETVTVASDSINDDTLLIAENIGGLVFDSGGGKDDVTIGIGADNFTARGGGDDDEFSVVETALGGTLYGDTGDDTFNVNNQSGEIAAYGGDNNDQFIIGEKIANGKFYGGAGDDTFTINASATLQSVEIDGGEGADTISLQNNSMVQDGSSINGKIRFDNIENLTASAGLSTLTLHGVATADGSAPTMTLQGQAGQTITASSGNVDFTIAANASASVNGYHYIVNGFDVFKGGDDNTNFHLNQRQGSTIIAGGGADNFIITAEDITYTINNFDGRQDTVDFTKTDASIFDLQITENSGTTTISADHVNTKIMVVGDFNADNNLLISRTKIMNVWTVQDSWRLFDSRENSIDSLDFDTNFGDYGIGLGDYVYANLSDSARTINYFGSDLDIAAGVASVRGIRRLNPFTIEHMDNVIGSGGSDVLIGNDGDNRLDGGQGGDDIFYGGKGDDIFVVLPMDGAGDFIGDFAIAGIAGSPDRDRIDISGLAISASVNFIVREADAMNATHEESDIVIEDANSSFGVELALDSAGKTAVQNSGLDIDIYVENYFKNNRGVFIGYDPYGTPKTDRATHAVGSEFQWKNSDADLIFSTDKYDILNYGNAQYDNKETAVAVNLSSAAVHAGTFIDSINIGRLQQMNLQLSGNTRYESFDDGSLFMGKVYSVDGVYGSKGDDIFYGSAAGEILDGKDGNNSIFGGAGNDVISVSGGGENLLHGGDGDDTVSGGTGDDIIVAGGGSNTLSGGGGNDNFIIFADKVDLGSNTISDFDVSDKVFVIVDRVLDIAPISMAAVVGAVEFSIEDNRVGKIEFTNQNDVSGFLPHINIVHVDDAMLPNQIREPLRFSIDFDSSVTGAWQLNNEPAERQLTIADGQRFYLLWNDANAADEVDSLTELSQAYADGDFSVALNNGNLELSFANSNIITIDSASDYADTADDNFDAFIDAIGGTEWIFF